jgi:hypothetical protein
MTDYSLFWYFISKTSSLCTFFSYSEAYHTRGLTLIHITLTKSIDYLIRTQQINTPWHFMCYCVYDIDMLKLVYNLFFSGLKFILFALAFQDCVDTQGNVQCFNQMQIQSNSQNPVMGPWPHRYTTFMFTKRNIKAYVSAYRDHNFSWTPESALRFGCS